MTVHALSNVNYYSNEEAVPRLYTREEALAQRVETIASKRREQRDQVLSQTDWKGRFIVATDVLNVGYMGLEGVRSASHAISKISGVFWTAFICGALTGIANIFMGLISLHEARKDSSNTLQKNRLFLDGICQVSIGTIMLLVSLAVKVSALAAVGTAFANPWLIPLLLLMIALPTLVEVVKREVQMYSSKDDFITQLKELKKNLGVPSTFQNIKTRDDIRNKMESIEAEWGIDSAIEAMQLWVHLLRKEDEQAQKSIERLEICASKWKRSLHVRLLEKLLMVGSFGLSMIALNTRVNADRVNAANSFSLMGASAVPIYPDAAWLTTRNIPIVVPL